MKLRRPLPFRRSTRRGTTLVETIVSVGIFGFIVSFVAFLIFMGAINAYNVHDQVMAQSSAATAAERITSLLRNSAQFDLCSGDTIPFGTSPTFTRIQFTVPPLESSAGAEQVSVIAFHPGDTATKKPPSVQYFERAVDAKFSGTVPTGTPTLEFPNIASFNLRYESRARLQLEFGFQYRGFAMVFNNPAVPQLGQFTTDVVAKNRFLPYAQDGGYSDNYDAMSSTTLISL